MQVQNSVSGGLGLRYCCDECGEVRIPTQSGSVCPNSHGRIHPPLSMRTYRKLMAMKGIVLADMGRAHVKRLGRRVVAKIAGNYYSVIKRADEASRVSDLASGKVSKAIVGPSVRMVELIDEKLVSDWKIVEPKIR